MKSGVAQCHAIIYLKCCKEYAEKNQELRWECVAAEPTQPISLQLFGGEIGTKLITSAVRRQAPGNETLVTGSTAGFIFPASFMSKSKVDSKVPVLKGQEGT